ncbi:MAG: MmoB/DmpM family protein [Rhodoferax sp.]|uniref:MmoB/DmpM family protein n=1 Tax=Rhodoferax sp. TaxID=50421 RepID=UPI00272329A1|nr:MmoB/DmpM family protein [Rhodoferax sp.]MDO8449979.1 MmoB/DmpM family protein [Rhodoferax sp.]
MSDVFIAFQDNEDSRPIIEAILADNASAEATYPTGLVKINAPGSLVIRRESIEGLIGRSFNLQQIHVNLVTLSGHIDEDDDQFSLSWTH